VPPVALNADALSMDFENVYRRLAETLRDRNFVSRA
jgi:hypothetical protein